MAIRITTQSTTRNMVGKSHWWGAPDLPEGIPYPCLPITEGDETYYEPLTFVCQLRCADIVPYDTDELLPSSGMLYFFAPINYFLGETETPISPREKPVVIYSEQENGLHPYELCWEDTGETIFRPAEKIILSPMKGEHDDGHLLLARPFQEEIAYTHPGCLSLLQIDEDDRWGLRIYDCGMYHFLASPADLTARRWQNIDGDYHTY